MMSKLLRVKYPLFLSDFNETFSTDYRKKKLKYKVSSKSVQGGDEVFHADRQDMKLTVAFRNFANAPKKRTQKNLKLVIIKFPITQFPFPVSRCINFSIKFFIITIFNTFMQSI